MKQNAVSKEIPKLKKEGKDTTALFAEMKQISEEIKEYDGKIRELDEKIYNILLTVPNIPNETVPEGDTDEDNVEIRKWGEPTKFDFEPKAHWDLGVDLDLVDFDRGVKLSKTRFYIYKNKGARLISSENRRSPTERRIYIRRREETAIERKNSNKKGENRRFSTLDFLLI